MSISGEFPGSFLDGLLRASWQAAALVVIVVSLQRLLRPWLAARWRHALWLVVLARLLLPITPASGWSVFNLAPVGRINPAIQPGVRSTTVPSAPGHKATVSRPAGFEPTQRSRAPGDSGSPFDLESVPPIATVLPAGGPPTASVDLPEPVVAAGNGLPMGEVSPAPGLTVVVQWPVWFGGGLWLTGFVLVAGRVIFGSVRFGRTLSACRPLARPVMAAALDDCRRRLGVRREVAVFESEAVRSPALCGLWRPCLLWPPGLADTLRAEELRHVLLHELAHLKRRDILVNWIAALAQAVHWFNPAVWYAGRRLRADRELAADALVLAALGEPQARAYGETILKLLRGWSGPAAIPAMAGILEGKPAVRERIRAIAVYRAPGRWSALAGWLVAGLGLVTLTDAQPRNAAGPVADEATRAVAPVPTADNDAPFRPLNLARYYVTHWDAIKPGTSWDAVPKGRQTFDGVPFEVGGLLELSGMGVLRENKRFPSRVEGIPVGGRVGGLHLLHGAAYDAPDGTPIGRLVLHYADGETRDLPIRYGIHSRNWWVEGSEVSGAIGDPSSRVAWTGRSSETDARDATLRLFQTRFVNPRPDQPVTSLDFVSLLVRAPDYVARRETRWASPLSPELTIQLEPGIRIGGV
ncbi:MAG: M56 family metallopeptidase, partial [Limisphaerales bacterium]